MKLGPILFAIFFICLGAAPLHADIYSWTDAKGIKHFSNQPPADVKHPVVVFEEYKHDSRADKQRFEMDQKQWQDLIDEINAEDEKSAAEARKKAAEAEKNRPLTEAEKIAREKQRLETIISDLEKKPLEYFGSFKNKRVRLGYYRYKLEELNRNPKKYFSHPTSFEGNVKYPKSNN